jgi:putative ATP-dependent endonuclease of OLD family
MRLSNFRIRNFKALRDVPLPLSRFVCLIGENNAGKSSVMQALMRFIEGGKLDRSLFFDPSQDITLSAQIDNITDTDLGLIANSEHRSRFAAILRNGSITLVRRCPSDDTSRLRWMALCPLDPRFDAKSVDQLLEGKRPGSSFVSELAT